MDTLTVDPLLPADWQQVLSIYLEGIATGNSTFETEAPSWEAWDNAHRSDCRLAARQSGQLVGWAALSPVSRRFVYRGVAEASVYVAASARGQGVGRALTTAVIEASERAGIWTLQSSIFPENVASLALARSAGFRLVGRRERIGCLYGMWRDVLLLERRSPVVGQTAGRPLPVDAHLVYR